MDNFFIQALARAASCPQHAKQVSTLRETTSFLTAHHKTRRKSASRIVESREYKSTRAGKRTPFRIARKFAENELKALVDYYGIDTSAKPDEDVVDDGSLVWNIGDDHEPWPVKDPRDTATIEKLMELLKNEEAPHDEMFDTYKLLPQPGVVYLSIGVIRNMLRHLSIVERPTSVAMQRYLSILEDMKNAHIHIKRSEWTTAIHFAGRSMGTVSADEVQSALYVWRDMEQRANVKGSHVTFNVLFDIAVKAGKFTLADAFLKEMHSRGLKFHRHFRTSIIYYHGVMQNGSAVRRVYQEMVESGDVVDTVVMNAVIAALIRAGEPSAAEQVFERMKRLHANRTTPWTNPHHKFGRGTWRAQRSLGLHLTYEGRRLKLNEDDERHRQLQDWAPINPNSHTYSLLIRHHATLTGNIDRVNELLREMGYNGVPLEGTIYIVIFQGFNNFGGIRYSSWSRDKLEQTWTEYLQAVQSGLPRTWISQMSVVAALKAFKKCADSERTMMAWMEVRRLWEPSHEEVEGVLRTLRGLVDQKGFFDKDM
ncbi:hypothetical protein N0V90_007996 [Kalmusia sp. IMI 367209]|nr:hypothetical protein N0V90_007996 [Kalmusia sp. IMI 367209]